MKNKIYLEEENLAVQIFHVFRNTPLGKETLRQAADFVKQINGELNVYVPEHDRFMLYFEYNAVEISLNASYLYSIETAHANMNAVLDELGVAARLVHVKTKTGSTLPDIETTFDVISLPKVMTEPKGKLLSQSIGAGVRSLVNESPVPAIIGPGRFAEWNAVHTFFGGSTHSIRALKWAIKISSLAQVPLYVSSLCEGKNKQVQYENLLKKAAIPTDSFSEWKFWHEKSFIEMLNMVSRNSLIVMGAYGHHKIRSKLFGSKTELVLRNAANMLMLVGARCKNPEEL